MDVHRARSLNSNNVQGFFDILGTAIQRIEQLNGKPVTEQQFFNFDEMGRSLNRVKKRVLASRGSAVVSILCNSSREHTSFVSAVCASGHYLPPFFIVKGTRQISGTFCYIFLICFLYCFSYFIFLALLFVVPDYLQHANAGAAYALSDAGYMTVDVFAKFVDFFIKHSGKPDDEWAILVCDQHKSHTNDPASLTKLFDNKFILVGLPPHTTSVLQVRYCL